MLLKTSLLLPHLFCNVEFEIIGFRNIPADISSNINEVIRAVLNFLFFFYEKILHAQKAQKTIKSTKKHQKHKNH